MKITVIHGSLRRGSTWHCVDIILRELARRGETEVTEFFLPRDMPHFCQGCYQCFMKGEDACPHAAWTGPIADAVTHSDLVVLASPVYALDVSGQMKALLDHLCYQWLSHRPDPGLFNAVGLAVATTGGAGLRHTIKTLKNSLNFWGVKKVFSFRSATAAMKWSEVPEGKREKIEKDGRALAARIAKAVQNIKRLPNPMIRGVLFRLMAGMQKKNDWNPTDRAHWETQGWLKGGRPFQGNTAQFFNAVLRAGLRALLCRCNHA